MIKILGKDPSTVGSATISELSKCDIILLLDISGSMESPSHRLPRVTRLQEVKEDVIRFAQLAEKHDDDGLCLIPFSSMPKVMNGITAAKIEQTFKSLRPGGGTNLGLALKEAVKLAKASTKNTVVICFTDGEPTAGDTAFEVLNAAGRELGRPRFGATFVQVGTDVQATAYLRTLNEGLDVDVVACVSAEEAEGLSMEQLIWLATNA